MIGIDTNVLVRYLAADDPGQHQRARRLIEEECSEADPGYISVIVAVELAWVLRFSYKYDRRRIAELLSDMLEMRELRFEDQDAVRAAAQRYRAGGADFSDYLVASRNRAAGCAATATFDRAAGDDTAFRLI